MKIGVIGASGYSGGELLRLLAGHSEFKPEYVAAGSNADQLITSIHPHLLSYSGKRFSVTDLNEINSCALVFLALPHGESSKLVAGIDNRVQIVDLGADFRLNSSAKWSQYYGGEHAGSWTYGLPELKGYRERISKSFRIANPGCYATSIQLGIAPAIAYKIIDASDLVVVASSGTTGAGRTAKINLLGSEVMNSLTSYKFGGVHQHTPEVEENLTLINNEDVRVSFTPILAPMPRGILSTITAKLTENLSTDQVREVFEEYFAGEQFISLLSDGQLPRTSAVLGSNSTHIQVAVDNHTQRLVVSVAIDNLGKGAASQAIQNANLMNGLPEGESLSAMGVSG
jgi:N-acetyl-gamma-glutamyl-phosphate reductase